ncbi:kinesin-like protein KIF16B isoform X2 [Nematostella vectensis]|uniref:kinesin-like protein KIF16B isoform X2 n=1 Tax=Nematostella vectensis TaxID=45351 RepID=UPI0020778962|nr:kinesin-like protein KIF16B isoform X2 [Nematostella vectensis]
MASVKVAVRVRPLNNRENNMGAKTIIEMEGKKTRIYNVKGTNVTGEGERKNYVKDFSFDYSYWSADERSRHFVNQERVFKDLGTDVVKAAFEGYNACIFAYGQTGSGKTYTMMGHNGDTGLIPRICENMFHRMTENSNADDGLSFRTEVSYLEIYQERVRDLLRPPTKGRAAHSLRVREHPKEGPYVQDLTKHLVSDYAAIEHLMEQGNSHRVTASTGMNDVSSRSHAIFTMNFTQAKFDMELPCETASKINLVDLAGSERADATGATGERLKEGANINKSLVTLGTVISALADASTGHGSHGSHHKFIPYRDSVLTWLLKDSLGGNSKTIMIATISPADVNYAETMSTLRYANRAKNIMNKPTINEDPNVKLIRDLRSQIEKLKAMISPDLLGEAELAAAKKLSENEARVTQLTDKWKDRWKETQKLLQEREMKLQEEGVGIKMDSILPHLVLVDDDLLSTGITVYHLKEGKTTVGLTNPNSTQDIVISGPDTQANHCEFEHTKSGTVILSPLESLCYVNNNEINKPTRLKQGDVIILGQTNVFRFNHPKEAAELREKRKSVPGMPSIAWSTKFRSETDLVFRKLGDENLSKQLEKARSELEKQKLHEGQKLEEARHEFEKQIQEEGRQLEEMRAELERQRKLHAMEAQNVEEARQRVSELTRKHEIADLERTSREKELKREIENRAQEIKEKAMQLETLREESEYVKQCAQKEVDTLKETIRLQKEAQLLELNRDMSRIMELEAEKEGLKELLEAEKDKMKAMWDLETEKVKEQNNKLNCLRRDYERKFNSLEEARSDAMFQRQQFEKEKQLALLKIQESSTRLTNSKLEREKALQIAEGDLNKKKDLLELEIAEKKAELNEERKYFEDQVSEHEATMDFAADNLADAQARLDLRTKEENRKIEEAKEKFAELQTRLAKSAKELEEELERKREDYNTAADERRYQMAKKKDTLQATRSELETLVKDLSTKTGKERLALEKEIQKKDKIYAEQKAYLHQLETEDAKIRQAVDQELDNEMSALTKQLEQNQAFLKLERLNLEELQDAKAAAIRKDELHLKEAQEKYNEVKILLSESKKHLHGIDVRFSKAVGQHEQELLRLSQNLEQDLASRGQHEDVYGLREHRIRLKEIDVEGKLQVTDKKEEVGRNVERLSTDIKRLSFELEDIEKTQEKSEADLTQFQSHIERERRDEIATIDAMRESLQDMEEEASLSQSLSEDEIQYSSADNQLKTLLEKERLRVQMEMQKKLQDMEARQRQEMEYFKQQHTMSLDNLEQERLDLERQKEELEREMQKEKVALDKERRMLEREKLEEIDTIIRHKETEIEDLKEKAQVEIDELRDRLDETEREVVQLQERLTVYTSMASINLPHDPDDLADHEVMDYMYREDNDMYGSQLSLTGSVTPPRITPPPTPVNQFLTSVNNMRRNQIQVQIPRYILRGQGRDSYHVFEVKVTIAGDTWSVYRRYRKFRELHNTMKRLYIEVGELDFPHRRFFGNRAEEFVRARRAQLETYLKSFISLCASLHDCPISAFSGRLIAKRDLCDFAPFFKQGIFEQTKTYSG